MNPPSHLPRNRSRVAMIAVVAVAALLLAVLVVTVVRVLGKAHSLDSSYGRMQGPSVNGTGAPRNSCAVRATRSDLPGG